MVIAPVRFLSREIKMRKTKRVDWREMTDNQKRAATAGSASGLSRRRKKRRQEKDRRS
jgi:hypothetical protein